MSCSVNSNCLMHIEEAAFCAIDLETTGLNPEKDEIIAIAAIPIRQMRIQVGRTFHILIKPPTYRIDAMKYHGISPDDLRKAPTFADMADAILGALDGILIGHCVEFDMAFLKKSFKKRRVKFKKECLDIALIEQWLRERDSQPDMDISLDAMMKHYGLKASYRHDAAADAFFTAQIFQMQMRKMAALGIDTLDGVFEAVISCKDTGADFAF